MVQETLNHKQWLETAFRGDIPPEIVSLNDQRDTAANVFEEMRTAMPPELKQAVKHLYDLHNHETELMYSVVEHLFRRHLDDHPG